MADQERRMEDGHRRCANNCGLFGSTATRNLCSRCYRDFRLKQQDHAAAADIACDNSRLPSRSPSTTSSSCVTAPAPLVPTEEPASSATASAEQPQLASNGPSRCAACRKRVGLSAGFQCRCGATFCGAHRYPERHACGFDYKAAGREAIARANPLVRADKLRRI
ncbi:zinc finger A20 and AN1 domain-containing stress-associated protein 5-like [Ananas comosus]|uniref:Zinc finger A20 and AN1 domain-containing stress-associated protein 5-like n=1 Tax=Ananas comosus TaxID=4615 RepID=A0A6P5ELS7_ANACO|nr:zinc finger A20 and AN1 domain-containing stress-associated protein 5-like [Ananas comosus]XP_020082305.1 zinc finger A20 and AN1 domain-containing stress-associated protein 5-like [Ananas comosus]XP_020082306.1 zinc finger A20 and AN1 domain-containing stress-associated protein 5-like [Ananas comosus]